MRPALLLVLAAGCGPGGPDVYPAGGVVTFRGGRPVTAGVVEFSPDDGGPAARGKIAADGRFTLATGDRPGAVAGKHRVAVVPMTIADGLPNHAHKAVRVHAKHSRLQTSGLTAAVEPGGPNQFALEVDAAP